MILSTSFYSRTAVLICVGVASFAVMIAEEAAAAEQTSVLRAEAVLNGPQVHATFAFESRNNSTVFNGLINSGLNDNGNYSYHIHKLPVPSDGNCTATGGHLDPQGRNGTTCTSTTLDQCEMGDLSGKFGKIEVRDNGARAALPFIFEDPTLHMSGDNNIIGLSVVIHAPNGTRVGCGNIVQIASSAKSGSSSSSSGATSAIMNTNISVLSVTAFVATLMATMFM